MPLSWGTPAYVSFAPLLSQFRQPLSHLRLTLGEGLKGKPTVLAAALPDDDPRGGERGGRRLAVETLAPLRHGGYPLREVVIAAEGEDRLGCPPRAQGAALRFECALKVPSHVHCWLAPGLGYGWLRPRRRGRLGVVRVRRRSGHAARSTPDARSG